MVIETIRNGDSKLVYRRFQELGRMAPPGLIYLSSWVTYDLKCCYQLMETDSAMLLGEWMTNWSDLVDFETHVVINSEEAALKAGQLGEEEARGICMLQMIGNKRLSNILRLS